jgi:hypothetical protein
MDPDLGMVLLHSCLSAIARCLSFLLPVCYSQIDMDEAMKNIPTLKQQGGHSWSDVFANEVNHRYDTTFPSGKALKSVSVPDLLF